MSRSLLAILAAALICVVAVPSFAQTTSPTPPQTSPAKAPAAGLLAREKLPNDIGFELLGKAGAYSFYYQRMLNRFFGVEGGLSALGGRGGDNNTSILFLPIGARLYAIPKNGSFFVSGGIVFLSASTDTGPFSDSESATYGYLGPGMEFRSESGFLFRGTAYGLIAGGGFFIWPGLTVGYAF